jgi:hypothetical protein
LQILDQLEKCLPETDALAYLSPTALKIKKLMASSLILPKNEKRFSFLPTFFICMCVCLQWLWSYLQIFDQLKKRLPETDALAYLKNKKTLSLC